MGLYLLFEVKNPITASRRDIGTTLEERWAVCMGKHDGSEEIRKRIYPHVSF